MENKITVDRAALFSPHPLVALKAELSGFDDMRTAANAIRSALAANRIFCSRIVLDQSGAAYPAPAQKITCRVAVVNKNFEQIVAEQSAQPFDIANGELVRFFLQPRTNGAQLVIAAHKLVCDVRSLMILLEDIISALSGSTPERREARLADEDDLPDKPGIAVRLALSQLNKQWIKNKSGSKRVFDFEDYERIFARRHKGKTPVLLRGELPSQMIASADRTAALYGTDRTAVIMMALVNAIGEMANISYNVDTRADSDRTVRNLTFPVSLVHGYDERRDVCANIQYMQELMDEAESDPSKQALIPGGTAMLEPTLVDSVFMTALDGYADSASARLTRTLGYDGDTHSVSVSIIDASAHEKEKISVCPACELNTHISLAIVVSPGRVEISANCPDTRAAQHTKEVLDRFTKELVRLTKEEE